MERSNIGMVLAPVETEKLVALLREVEKYKAAQVREAEKLRDPWERK